MESVPADVASVDSGLAALADGLAQLQAALSAAEVAWSPWLAAVDPRQLPNARNMVHYWALRRLDLRALQSGLTRRGLSSLGRSEPHVQDTVRAVAAAVSSLSGRDVPLTPLMPDSGAPGLRRRAVDLLGPAPTPDGTRIMVTLPSSTADDLDVVRRLVERGMNVARINCAYGDAEAWRRMARNVRLAAHDAGRTCRVAMDLAGPKLRTGPLEPGPAVVKLRPHRDELGRVLAPAVARLIPPGPPSPPGGGDPGDAVVSVPVPLDWLQRREDGDVLTVRDTRGSKRRLHLTNRHGAWQVSVRKTSYLGTGTVLVPDGDPEDTCEVGALPPREQKLLLQVGDVIVLTRDCTPAAVRPDRPQIGCTLPEVFDRAVTGQNVYFDDGRIGGLVVDGTPEALRVKITHAEPGGSRLGGGKGINVPDTRLDVPALTAKDLLDLGTVVELADIVELSFVREPADVTQLLHELDRLGDDRLGVVLKIETARAFEQLPQLLLTAMSRPVVGVMIARGDLAVECGYERVAELQEEIMWLCEAAHVPVIWATQVLEQLTKHGHPSRAEISDAAMGERAECVMLNKGPYIDESVTVLADVLSRMSAHHDKQNALLPPLHSWYPEVGVSGGGG